MPLFGAGVVGLLVVLAACSDDSKSTGSGTEGQGEAARVDASATLHADCSDGGTCSTTEQCLERGHPEGAVKSCAIRCESDSTCPRAHRCHAPPCVPDDVFFTLCAPVDD